MQQCYIKLLVESLTVKTNRKCCVISFSSQWTQQVIVIACIFFFYNQPQYILDMRNHFNGMHFLFLQSASIAAGHFIGMHIFLQSALVGFGQKRSL